MNKISFKANIPLGLRKRLEKDASLRGIEKFGYIEKLTNEINKYPKSTIDIIKKGSSNSIKITSGEISKTHATTLRGDRIDIIEGALEKKDSGTSLLEDLFQNIFSIDKK